MLPQVLLAAAAALIPVAPKAVTMCRSPTSTPSAIGSTGGDAGATPTGDAATATPTTASKSVWSLTNGTCVDRSYTMKTSGFDSDFWMSSATAADQRKQITYTGEGMVMTLSKAVQHITLISERQFYTGELKLRAQMAPGAGVVSSAFFANADLVGSDEMDLEVLGSMPKTYNSVTWIANKASPNAPDRLDFPGNADAGADLSAAMHDFSLKWTNSTITWTISDAGKTLATYTVKRNGPFKHANGLPYLATDSKAWASMPLRVRLGPWFVNSADASATGWAGVPNFASDKYVMKVASLSMTGCEVQ